MPHPSIIGSFDAPSVHIVSPRDYLPQTTQHTRTPQRSVQRQLIAAMPADVPGEFDDDTRDRRTPLEIATDEYLKRPTLAGAERLRAAVRGH